MAVGTRVKGITIEFDGDTTKLGNALKKVEKEAAGIDKSLKQVNTALKFNPKNAELMAQKQQLLTQKVDATKKKLEALKRTQAQLDDDPAVDKTSQDYMELRREIITTESKLQHFEGELKKANNAKFTQLGNSIKSVGQKMSTIGRTMSTYVTGPIVAGYTLAAKSASDYEENLNKLDVAFGENAKSVTKWAQNAGKQFGLSKVQATGAASAFGALAKGIGFSEKDAAGMSTTLAGLSADLGSYFNVGVDESSKALEGIFTGESEALKKFGVVMTDTNLQQFAEDQGLVWKELSQTEKTQLRYNYVLAKTKDAQGDFSRTSSGTANSIKIFQTAISDLATAIGTALLPIVTPIIQKITSWVQKFNELSPATQKIITVVGLIVAAVGPLLLIFGQFATAIGAIIKILPTLKAAMATAFGPWGLLIAGVIAAVILLWKNWDKVKKLLLKIWNAIKKAFLAVFNAIKTAIITYWKTIWTITKTVWTTIFNVLKTIWTAIKTAASIVLNAIVGLFRKAWAAIKTAWANVKQFFINIWNGIKAAFANVGTWFAEKFRAAAAAIRAAFGAVKSFFSGVWSKIKGAFGNVAGFFRGKFSAAWTAIKNVFSNVASFFGGIWGKIKDKFSNLGTKIGDAIKGAVASGINGIVSSIEKIINKGIGLINGAIKWINKIPGVNIGKLGKLTLPRLTWHKKGGIFDAPSVIGVGEAGPEAVVPLNKFWDKLDAIAANNSPMVVNVYGSDNMSVDELATAVQQKIIQAQKRRTMAWQ